MKSYDEIEPKIAGPIKSRLESMQMVGQKKAY